MLCLWRARFTAWVVAEHLWVCLGEGNGGNGVLGRVGLRWRLWWLSEIFFIQYFFCGLSVASSSECVSCGRGCWLQVDSRDSGSNGGGDDGYV